VSSTPPSIVELLAELHRLFARLGVRWFLFGAQAAILHGVARLSADVDVTVDLGDRPTRALAEALAAAGFELRVTDVDGFVEQTRVLPVVHRASRIPVDLVLAGPGLEEQFFAGAEHRRIGEVDVPIASAEDLVAMKILAGRPRDLDDVAAIVTARRRDLDLNRVRGTLRLLEKALDRRDLAAELERLLAASGTAGGGGGR
jgi:hypothetical protein